MKRHLFSFFMAVLLLWGCTISPQNNEVNIGTELPEDEDELELYYMQLYGYDPIIDEGIIKITLNNNGADLPGTKRIFLKYNESYYLDRKCEVPFNIATGVIDCPVKDGYVFLGYNTEASGNGQLVITDEGAMDSYVRLTTFDTAVTLYAQWSYLGDNGEPVIPTTTTIPEYVMVDGVKFSYDMTELIRYPEDKTDTSYIIPDTVKTIGNWAFGYRSNLTNITIPDSVTKIGGSAFEDCTGLTSINIPNGVTSIGYGAFRGCTGLTSIVIPDSVVTVGGTDDIGSNIFDDCSGLTEPIYNSHLFIYLPRTYSGTYTIPNGITEIGNYAFEDCSELTSIIIPDTVTSIGISAFSWCKGLISIVIPNGITTIEARAFINCSGLTSMTLGGVKNFGENAFAYCDNLTRIDYTGTIEQLCCFTFESSIYDSPAYANPIYSSSGNIYINNELVTDLVIPDTVTEIKSYAFCGWKNLTSVTIPDSVTVIGECAFYGCTALENLSIGNGVMSIGNKAFCSCPITYLTIGSSIIEIDPEAFRYENESYSIHYNANNTMNKLYYNGTPGQWFTRPDNMPYPSKEVYSEETSTFIEPMVYINGTPINEITEAVLPDGMTEIKSGLCKNMSGLTSAVIPNTVINIGAEAFSGCTGLTSIIIPDSVKSIGANAFSGCTGLTSMIIPDSVTSIGDNAFCECSSLTNVTIGNSVTEIGAGAFECCTGLTSVVIPDSVTVINDATFKNCNALTSVTLGKNVKIIGEGGYGGAFQGCSNLTSIEIPNSVTSIGSSAFAGCTSLISIVLPNVTSIGAGSGFYDDGAFYNSGLTSAVVNNVEYIPKVTFSQCANLTDITIDSGVKSLGASPFYLTDYQHGQFYLEGNVNTVHYQGTLSEWCDVDIYADPDDTYRSFSQSYDLSYVYQAGKNEYNTPNPYNAVHDLYIGDELLTDLVIPNDVTKIKPCAFFACWSLRSITIPGNVEEIGDYAFMGCSEVTSLSIGEGVRKIGVESFSECSKLTKIILPSTIEWISSSAFIFCEGLTELRVEAVTPPVFNASCLYLCTSLEHIYVPNGSVEAYKTALGWDYFADKISAITD